MMATLSNDNETPRDVFASSLTERINSTLYFGRRAFKEALQGRHKILEARPETTAHDLHFKECADWLKYSIKICGGKASSKGYRFGRGWMPPYPETTGYIIPTLLNLGETTGDAEWNETAIRLGQWLISIQRSDGGFAGYELGLGQDADVFDTGMILLGFNALQLFAPDPRIEEASAKAAKFLCNALDDNGAFAKHISHDMLHCYNVRSAWALVAHGKMSNDESLIVAGLKNVDWTLKQQLSNGFFQNNGFKPGGNANTHGIAYVLRGLLQIYFLTERQDILQAVLKAAIAVRTRFEAEGWLASEIGPDWNYRSQHICLTGCVQLSIIFFKLAKITSDQRFTDTAEILIAQVAATRKTTNSSPVSHYGIAGSYPVHGAYAPLQFPNWATKFMLDALMVRSQMHEPEVGFRERDLLSG